MTKFKFIGVFALLSTVMAAAPAFAQAAIDEPGLYSFYHPNGDVLNAGSVRPSDAMASIGNSNAMVRLRHATMSHRIVARRGQLRPY